MAIIYLTSSNWNDAGWGGTKPIDGDDCAIPESLKANVTGGNDQTGIDVDLLYIHPGYSKSLFTTGAPLKIAGTRIEHWGSGPFFFSCAKDSGVGNHKTDNILICSVRADVVTELNSVSGDAGDIDGIQVLRGNVLCRGDLKFGATCILRVGFVDNRVNDSRVTISAGSVTLPTLTQDGGNVNSNRAITAATVRRGKLVQDVAAIVTLNIGEGGVVDYRHTSATTIVVESGGFLDLMSLSNEKTITNLTLEPGSRINWKPVGSSPFGLHTATNLFDHRTAKSNAA